MMDDSPEIIRQQMQKTKAQLSEKLESLEQQVSATVQSTGTAVNSTMRSVEDAVHSVSNAFDIRHQIDRHPWLVLGGAVAVGYLLAEYLEQPAKKKPEASEMPPAPSPTTIDSVQESVQPTVDSTVKATAAAYESGRKSSSWHQIRDMAIGSLIAIVPEITARIVPRIVDQLIDNWARDHANAAETTGEQNRSSGRQESPEAAQRLRVVSSKKFRS